MNNFADHPVLDFIVATVLILAGILMFVYRAELGAITGYYTGTGGRVDKPTPGWMIIPFALALIVAGAGVILKRLGVWGG